MQSNIKLAGIESMIVEEKHPPTKQIDREKVKYLTIILIDSNR